MKRALFHGMGLGRARNDRRYPSPIFQYCAIGEDGDRPDGIEQELKSVCLNYR